MKNQIEFNKRIYFDQFDENALVINIKCVALEEASDRNDCTVSFRFNGVMELKRWANARREKGFVIIRNTVEFNRHTPYQHILLFQKAIEMYLNSEPIQSLIKMMDHYDNLIKGNYNAFEKELTDDDLKDTTYIDIDDINPSLKGENES
jgi:hypothetical protein